VAEAPFDVHPNLAWHSVDNDDVKKGWEYHSADNTVTDPAVAWLATPGGQRSSMIGERTRAYGTFGDQLDAIYRDMRDGTTKYVDHISSVKAKHAHVDPVDPGDKDHIRNPD